MGAPHFKYTVLEILEAMHLIGVPVHAKDMARNLRKATKSQWSSKLANLSRKGLIKRVSRGTYALLDTPTPTPHDAIPHNVYFSMYSPEDQVYGSLMTRKEYEDRMASGEFEHKDEIHLFTLWKRKQIRVVTTITLEDKGR